MNKTYDLAILIEDNDISSLVTQSIVMNSGLFNSSVILPSGFSALQYLSHMQFSKQKSILFLDIKMPQISGFDFLLQYEKMPETIRENLKIIILSGNNYETELKLWKQKKIVSGSLEKPLTSIKLSEMLDGILQ